MNFKDRIEDAIADAGLSYSHLSDVPDGDIVVWYRPEDDASAIVQSVEREGVATYQGEEKCVYDDVTGLVFSPRDDYLPLDVEDAAASVVEKCEESQDGEVVIPVTAIDEAEMPERLPEDCPNEVWDNARDAIIREVENRGYRVS